MTHAKQNIEDFLQALAKLMTECLHAEELKHHAPTHSLSTAPRSVPRANFQTSLDCPNSASTGQWLVKSLPISPK